MPTDLELAPEGVDLNKIFETSLEPATSDCPMTIDRVLRRLEVLRQRLAIRWCGVPGAFAGYEQLDIESQVEVNQGTFEFQARLVRVSKTTHTVELTASFRPDSDQPRARALVRGTGRTLQVLTCSNREHPAAAGLSQLVSV